MNQFVQRVANWIANEIFIKGLAESKTFQRFVVHTDRHIQKFKNEGLEQINSQMDELHKHATKAAFSSTSNTSSSAAGGAASGGGALKPPQKPGGFVSALGKVIRRDLGLDK
mmetsp:Transcript_27413/g.57626  ORF Transcript_27413/g.57626 Transcript_27413/m.57626 type:complete len:112 (+) Transcript_27413:215-550(+)